MLARAAPAARNFFAYMPPYSPLVPPAAGFNADGRFSSASYGDVYHSQSGALGQAEHVFLRGNGLPQRWRGRQGFTVCETGFGLGLNFLALWHAWRNDPARPRRLHMLSIEAHPFARDALRGWLQRLAPAALRDRKSILQVKRVSRRCNL